MAGLRMTTPRRLVPQAFMQDPERERYGLDLALEAGLEPGTIYPILVAFEGVGRLSSREEDVDVHAEGRPRRRYYKLTGPRRRGDAQLVLRPTNIPARSDEFCQTHRS
jgi:PadR family transcriptional regulator, regulatory protein PadR